MTKSRSRFIVPVMAVAALACPASAEQADRAPALIAEVPMDVVMRLLFMKSPEQLTLGGMPDEVARRIVLPADVQVIATASHCCETRSWHVAAIATQSEAELRQALAASLQQAGWKRPPAPYSEPRSGFVASLEQTETQTFCGPDNNYLTTSMRQTEKDVTSLDLHLYSAWQGGTCEAEQFAGPTARPGSHWADTLIPALEPPANTRSFGQGSSSSGDYMQISATLETDLSPEALLDHYGDQLAAAGWRIGQAAGTSRLSAADVEVSSSGGNRFGGFLLIWCGLQSSEQCEAQLGVTRVAE